MTRTPFEKHNIFMVVWAGVDEQSCKTVKNHNQTAHVLCLTLLVPRAKTRETLAADIDQDQIAQNVQSDL